jgi:acetyl-CoA carboxylase biotin carboxylase subunit
VPWKPLVCPWCPGSPIIETDRQAEEAIERIGFPVIIKATGGGGGRGMKIVEDKSRLFAQLAAARSEAQAGFNNPAVYIERYIGRPRHIEVQVLGRRSVRHRPWASASVLFSAGTRN